MSGYYPPNTTLERCGSTWGIIHAPGQEAERATRKRTQDVTSPSAPPATSRKRAKSSAQMEAATNVKPSAHRNTVASRRWTRAQSMATLVAKGKTTTTRNVHDSEDDDNSPTTIFEDLAADLKDFEWRSQPGLTFEETLKQLRERYPERVSFITFMSWASMCGLQGF